MKQIKTSNVIDTTNDPSLLLEQANIDIKEVEDLDAEDAVSDFELLDTSNSIIVVTDSNNEVTTTPTLEAPTSLVIVQQNTSLGEDGVTYVDIEFEIGDVKGAVDYEFRLVKL